MKSITRRVGSVLGTIGVGCALALASLQAAGQEPMTAQSLIDRQMILDQITRYYYNFGKSERQAEETFYAADGVLILGTRRYEGREGIKQAYTRPAPPAGAAPAPPRERLPFNITVDNALIVVRGNTATSQVIFTEYRPEKQGDPMKMTTQGKEYATWVKVDGKWLYKTRQIAGGSEPPEGWKD